jgi:hypothetical protein
MGIKYTTHIRKTLFILLHNVFVRQIEKITEAIVKKSGNSNFL